MAVSSKRFGSSSARGAQKKRMFQLRMIERLELRELMASDLKTWCEPFDLETAASSNVPQGSQVWSAADVDKQLATQAPDYFYKVNGLDQGLVVHPGRIAIDWSNAAGTDEQELASLGLNFVRTLNAEYSVYEATTANKQLETDKLLASGIVQDIAPVFVAVTSRSEAVLLDELIVSLAPNVSADEFFAQNTRFSDYQPLAGTSDQFIAKVASGTGVAALDALNAIQGDSRLAWAEPNFYQNWQKYFTPNDTRFANQWHLNNSGQSGGVVDADSDLPEAWDVIAGGSSDYTIGVIDDGVVTNHPDLTVWVNTGETAGDGIDNDGNGWIDDVNGWNFVANNNQSTNTTATDMHGTSVAGVAAAKGNNSLGVAGASYNSKVLSARIFEGTGVASDANIASALYYAAGRKASGTGTWKSADVLNNSWGGGASATVINNALTYATTSGRQGKGAPVFIAAGNEYGLVSEPALQSLNIAGVFAVGASNNKGQRSDYSNFGSAVDISTPSSDGRTGYLAIDTTDRPSTAGYDPSDYTGTGANGFGGTSSATPFASGIAALTMARADQLSVVMTPAQLRSYLRSNTDIVGTELYNMSTGRNDDFGFGRLNAASAVSNLGKAEISVMSTNSEIFSGTTTVNAGSAPINTSLDVTFRVRNQGTSTLNLSSLTVSSGAFAVLTGLGSTNLGLGAATTFVLRFLSTSVGSFSSTVTIGSYDTDEGNFSFAVSATAVLPSIAGSVFEDWDADGVKDAADTAIGGATVFLDANNNGVLDASLGSTTFTQSTAKTLVDGGLATSTFTVTGATGFITDLNVRLNITHTYDADLGITLVSPSGTRVLLLAGAGADGNNFTNTVLDDEASTDITLGTAPLTGSFHPSKLLSAFDGQSANGTWTLEVNDAVSGDTGTLTNWSLIITAGEKSTVTRTDGGYTFGFLPTGSYTVRTLAATGSSVVGSATQAVTLSTPSDSFSDRNFSVNRNNRFYGQVFEDTDSDGVFDATESPLAGYVLFDDTNNNSALDSGETSATTSALGTASFDLAIGTHRMRLVGQAGWTFTIPTDGLRTVSAVGTPLSDQRFGVQQAALAPGGTDKTVTLNEDGSYAFTASDFGFVDPRTPASALLAVKVTSLPGLGQLRLNSSAVTAGQFISVSELNAGSFTFAPAANGNGTPYSSWTFQVQDDGGTAAGRIDLDPTANTMTMNVSAVNDAPVLITSSGSASFTGLAPVIVDGSLVISDIDSTTLSSATIAITAGLVSSQDALSFTSSNGISGAYNATSGVLTLSGTASLANYQAALRSIAYSNSSSTPDTTTRTIRFVVNDGAGQNSLSNEATRQVTVASAADAPVFVFSTLPTTTGVKVVLNRPVNAGLINLYDQGGDLGPSDVTLVGSTTGPVRGSIVFDPGNSSFTFIKTGSIGQFGMSSAATLAADTYTLTLRSDTNSGWVDMAGNALRDSSGNVGNYVTNFTVSAPASNVRTLSVPDFMRGYGQVVNVPNTATGLPVTISNGNNVSGVDFTLQYNPAMLNVTGFASDIPGVSVFVNTNVPGIARVQVSTLTSFATADGPLVVGRFTASVPIDAAYAGKEILELTNLVAADASVNVSPIPLQADNGLHVSAFFGDNNGDGAYSSADTTLLGRVSVLANSGFSALKQVDPWIVSDFNVSGSFTSADTSLLLRQTVGLPQSLIPALPQGTTPPTARGTDPRMFIPEINAIDRDLDLAGIQVDIPINLEVTDQSGITVSGFDVVIGYDPAQLHIDPRGATTIGALLTAESGNLLGTNFSVAYAATTEGILRLEAVSTDGTKWLEYGTTGSIVNIRATIDPKWMNNIAINLMANYAGSFTQVTDNLLNQLLLSPAPTNNAADYVDGIIRQAFAPVLLAGALASTQAARDLSLVSDTRKDQPSPVRMIQHSDARNLSVEQLGIAHKLNAYMHVVDAVFDSPSLLDEFGADRLLREIKSIKRLK